MVDVKGVHPTCAESCDGLADDDYDVRNAGISVTDRKNASKKAKGNRVAMHINSTQIEGVLNPVRGIRDAQRRQGIKPVNHAKHNVEAVKQMSHVNSLRKMESNKPRDLANRKPKPDVWKLSRKNAIEAQRRSCSGGRDFVNQNILEAGTQKPIKPNNGLEDNRKWMHKEGYGQVPQYLQNRKVQIAKMYAAKQAAKEAAMLPPGMRMMDETERKEALGILCNNKVDVEAQLQGLPLIIETPGQVKLKASLEKRLREIEDAQKVFSRPKVLVKI